MNTVEELNLSLLSEEEMMETQGGIIPFLVAGTLFLLASCSQSNSNVTVTVKVECNCDCETKADTTNTQKK